MTAAGRGSRFTGLPLMINVPPIICNESPGRPITRLM